MKGKNAALSWTLIHSIADTIEDKVLHHYNEIFYLFWLNIFTGIFIIISGLISGIELTFFSFLVILVYSFAMICGGICYTKGIQMVPISLAKLIGSGGLFIILICDVCLGYIKPKFTFILLFCIFFLSVYIFSKETDKMKKEIINKKVDLKGIFILITATIFYASEPYFIKLASSKGANEFGINVAFYLISIPFYFIWLKIHQKNIPTLQKTEKKTFFKNMVVLGILYSITDILALSAYVGSTPIIISIIFKIQIFLIVIFSVIRKTDKMNWKKVVSLITGMTSIILMLLIS